MGKFILGIVFGVAVAFGYVRWHVSLPAILQFPDALKSFFVASAVDGDLYDLDRPLAHRNRALEVLFQSQPKWAATRDAEFGHPFLRLLYRRKVMHQARQLRTEWRGYDAALGTPALRKRLEARFGVSDDAALKRKMLFKAFGEKDFLPHWVKRNVGAVSEDSVFQTVVTLSTRPTSLPLRAR